MRVHIFRAALVNDAGDIDEGDVLTFDAHSDEQVEASDPGCAATGGDELDIFGLFADNTKSVAYRRASDDSGAVLVVVENRDVHAFAALLLDDKALGRLDVL